MAIPADILQRLSGVLSNPNTGTLGAALLANSGYSNVPRSFGQIAGTSYLQAQQIAAQNLQAQQEQEMNAIRKRYMEAQIGAMGAKPTGPASVQEYEYARQNGFKGSFQDWIVAGGQSSRPSAVQEWEFYSSLPKEVQQRYLEMKRNPNIVIKDIGQVPTAVAPSVGFGTKQTPLSTLEQEARGASTMAAAKGQGGAVGTATGEAAGGIIKKGVNADTVIGMLDIADPLVDAATGSLAGAGRDRLAAVFGKAPEGAQAIAQLKVLQAGLMLNMPRMEGPQSDKDTMLYREAAGQLGDPTVPREIKKAAIRTIRQLQEKYKDAAKQTMQIYKEGEAPDSDPLGILK